MDYAHLLYKGLRNSNSKHLTQYIFREFKNAELKHYSKDEFFDGCQNAVDTWKNSIDKSFNISMVKLDNELVEILKLKGVVGTDEQTERMIQQVEYRKEKLKKEIIRVPIESNNKIIGSLNAKEVEFIELSLLMTQSKLLDDSSKILLDKIKNHTLLNKYPETFKKGEFHLFDYLYHEIETFKGKSRASMLYHYFKGQEKLVNYNQVDFLHFLLEEYDLTLSRIFPVNGTMETYIKHSLPQMVDNFKKHTNEANKK